jgi:hypothetical protein
LTQQSAALDGRRSADHLPAVQRNAAVSNPRLVQMAAVLGKSPQLQALVQRKTGLQKPGVHQLTRGGQPVIQRKTEVKYSTQPVGYKDANGTGHVEHVGSVADAWIDAADPITGTAPKSSVQQPEMYQRLKAQYGQGFVRGHLLNDNLGGVGEVYNLFPITYSANSEHKITAEGHLKRYIRTEQAAMKNNLGGPYFVHYRVFAVPANGGDLTANADAEFLCEMVAAHSLLPGGHSQTWKISSKPKAKVEAIGDRSSKDDYQNHNLGAFGSSQTGEHDNTHASRMRSTVDGWRGDEDYRFASKGIGTHLELVRLKKEALDKLGKKLEDHPLYDEFYFIALEKAERLLSEVHEPKGIPKALDLVDRYLEKWVVDRRRHDALYKLREWLKLQPIEERFKTDMYNRAKQDLDPIVDLMALEQTAQNLSNAIRQQVDLLLKQPQPLTIPN